MRIIIEEAENGWVLQRFDDEEPELKTASFNQPLLEVFVDLEKLLARIQELL